MSHRRILLAVPVSLVVALAQIAGAQLLESFTVSAGDIDRRDVIVPVTLPETAGIAVWTLRDDAGNTTPLQVGPGGRGRFILGELKAGQTRRYRLDGAGGRGAEPVEVEPDGGALRLRFGDKYLLDYQGQMTDLPEGVAPIFQRGGYIHPVYT